MPVPSTRTPVRIARGDYANISDANALAALEEGEICFATDEGRLYVKEGAGLTSVSSTNSASPTPAQVTASPAFTGGTGTEADPYLITNGAVPFASGTAESAQEITVTGTPGDIVVFTDNSDSASANRFKNQDVGIINSNGEFKLKLKYEDIPATTTDNTTYTGKLQVGSVHFTWVVVQSALTALSEASATTISFDALAVGGTGTAVEGVLTGGNAPYTYSTRWQRSFTGTGGWFDTGVTGTSYTLVNADAGYYLRAVTTGTDSTATNAGGPLTLELPSAASAQVNLNAVGVVNSLTLTANNINANRYTSETFKATAVMSPEGVPTTTKNVKVEFGGSLQQYPQTDNVTSTTSGDPIGTNVNATDLDGTRNGGGDAGSTYYSWHPPLFYSGTGGAGFINLALYYSSTYNMYCYYTSEYGISNDQPYSSSALSNNIASGGTYYKDTTLSGTQQWYYYPDGSGSSNYIYHASMYKPDCLLIYSQNTGWVTIDNFSVVKSDSNLSRLKPIAHNKTVTSQYSIGYVDANDVKYSVLCDSTNFYVMEGDLTDYDNCTSTTVAWNNFAHDTSLPAGYTQPNYSRCISHGTKITVAVRFYVNNSYYRFRMYTCDFSQNDGTSMSHWVFKQEIDTGSSNEMYPGYIAVNPENEDQIWTGFYTNFWYSSDGGESWSAKAHPNPNGWSRAEDVQGFTWHRGKLLCIMKAYATWNGSGSNDSNKFWVLSQSSDGGTNWTAAQYDPTLVNEYNTSHATPSQLISPSNSTPLITNGGWIFAAGNYAYSGTSNQYYRSGLYIKDKDTVNLAGTTNLTNNAIREGDKVIQPGTNPTISAYVLGISGSTIEASGFNGATAFENNKPLQNTVSYFGGTTSTMWGVMDTGGNVTDLTGTDPGYTNMGYSGINTITMPATFPSGNTPDYELPAGTTIKTEIEFRNSSGIVTVTSNTLTPT